MDTNNLKVKVEEIRPVVVPFVKREHEVSSQAGLQGLGDAQLMLQLYDYIDQINDEGVKKALMESWSRNALKVGIAKFLD